MRDPQKIIAVTLAIILHVLVMASFVFAFDWARRDVEPLPLAVTATLVSADEPVRPPVVEQESEPEPESESEPEPVPEPEEPEPDPAAEARAKAEEQARLEELRREQQRQEEARLQRIEDEKRKAEEEARRKAAEEEAQRKREADLERKRVEAERLRKEEEERQRLENERQRREAEARQLQEQVEAEDRRLAARNSEDAAAYEYAIKQKVQRAWIKPASAPRDLNCEVNVKQNQNGDVLSVTVVRCNGDDIVVRSIEAAVRKASPLPEAPNPLLFDADLVFDFVPGDQ